MADGRGASWTARRAGSRGRSAPPPPTRARPPPGAPRGAEPSPGPPTGRSSARRVLPGEGAPPNQQQQLVARVAQHRDGDDGDVHQVESQARLRLPDEEAEARARVDHLGRKQQDERERQRDAKAREDERQSAGQHHLAKDLRPPRAHVETAPHHDPRRPPGAVVGVDEARIEARQRDDRDLRGIADPDPEHHDRQEHDLRHWIRQEHDGAQELIETARDPGQEPEADADQRADDESRQRARQARADMRQELTRPERLDEVDPDVVRNQDDVWKFKPRRSLPKRQQPDQQGRGDHSLDRSLTHLNVDAARRPLLYSGVRGAVERPPASDNGPFRGPHQNKHTMPSSSASELTRSIRFAAIRNPSAVRRRRCSTTAPHTRWRSRRYSTRTSVEPTRVSGPSASSTRTFPT